MEGSKDCLREVLVSTIQIAKACDTSCKPQRLAYLYIPAYSLTVSVHHSRISPMSGNTALDTVRKLPQLGQFIQQVE